MTPEIVKGKTRFLAVLSLVFALALAVRLIGLNWGLPSDSRWYPYHPDESTRQIVGAVVSLIQVDFNPHFFNYPSLCVTATWLIYQFLAVLGLTTNAVSPEYPWPVVRDIIFAGRLFSVFCGALTAPLVFLIARRLGLGKWAILAAILAALAPGHVQHSHFATVDVPATFFVTLCLYLTLRAQNTKSLLWAALVAGLAAGTKYNAGLVVVAPLFQAFLLGGKKGALVAAATIPVSIFGFLLSTPYALLAPKEFWGDANGNGFYFEAFVHPKIGSGDIFQGTGNGWIYHFTFNLPFVLTWPIIIAALVGIVFAAKKRDFWPIFAFLGLFFFSLGLSQVRFMRYLLPLSPMLCLLAAYGASQLRFSKAWGAMLSGFVLVGAANVLWPLVQTDSRDRAAQFARGRFSVVALAHNPWFYTPPLAPQGFNAPVAGTPDGKTQFQVTGFDLTRLPRQPESGLVLNEFEWRESVRLDPHGSVARFVAEAHKSNAIYKTSVPWALPGRDFVPHDYLYTNPETVVHFLG